MIDSAALLLDPMRLELRMAPQPAHEPIECPCQKGVEDRVPLPKAMEVLLKERREGVYVAFLCRDVIDFRGNGSKGSSPREVDPTATEDQVLFVRRDALGSLRDLRNHHRVRRLVAIEKALQELYRGYVLGPPLGTQPHSRELRRMLRRAVQFLRALGLIDAELVAARQPHLSVVLLSAAALGIDDRYELLVRFLQNPCGLIARAIANAVEMRDAEKTEFAAELERAFWDVAEGYQDHQENAGVVPQAVRFKSSETGIQILEGLASRYEVLSRRVGMLATVARTRRLQGYAQVGLVGKGVLEVRRPRPPSWQEFETFVDAEDNKVEPELAILAREREQLVRRHPGKFVLVRRGERPEVFASEEQALDEGYRRYGDESFLVEYLGEERSRGVVRL